MVEYTTYEAIGQSEAFIAFQEQFSRVAPVERPVMIIGERGVGKELAASRIHFLSTRWKKTAGDAELCGSDTHADRIGTVRV